MASWSPSCWWPPESPSRALSFREAWLLAALAPLGLLALGVAFRLGEFRRYAHIPGPKPSFFVGSLRYLLLHEHGARDRALVELHRVYARS
jgi:hypothetical protein